MSRCAHRQSNYKLRKLPYCSKCKNVQFILVAAVYEGTQGSVEEWECPKCHKVVDKKTLEEEKPSEWEIFLEEKCKEIDGKGKKRKNTFRHLRPPKQRETETK